MSSSKREGSSISGRGLAPEELFPSGQRLGRYEILRHIGTGGMGVVYQARDTERGDVVALKTLHRLEPGSLLRLKNEFRFISNVSHRNLVSLHELLSVEDQWFFTMEYVDGDNLWDLLQRSGPVGEATASQGARSASTDATVTVEPVGAVDPTVTSEQPEAPKPRAAEKAGEAPWVAQPRLPMDELRRIFRELALGIQALHSARKLHCDIKPRNVMVARDGRVVLLDFGLASDRAEPSASELAGTPTYISPERVLGQPASEASDWYAFGVMLYEALTGRRAFPGSRSLMDKASLERPAFPSSPGVPEDLRELCLALLEHEPQARPGGHAVLERLGVTGRQPDAREGHSGELLGREAHLAALRECWHAMRQGRTVVAHVHGLSGMGKTSLVHRFFEELGQQERAVVLSGRCHERESVPYKAFDSLVDSLARHLRTLPGQDAQGLVPPDAAELVRIFPVLRQVEAFAPFKPERLEAVRDRAELRRRALRAFKELLRRLAARAPLALHLDDFQWADDDSIVALGEQLDPLDAPALLWVVGYRSGEGAAVGLLGDHQHRAALAGEKLGVREVEVGALSGDDARRLAAHLLGVEGTDPRVERIAREAHGSPFFVEELTHYVRDMEGPGQAPTDVSLERLVQARVRHLPEDTRHLLEAVAVAGQPVPRGQVSRVAELGGDPHAPWTLLRSTQLVRTQGSRDEDGVECYHDRIRESVQAGMTAGALQGHHLTWATVLEASGGAEPERLARHFREGGQKQKAGGYAAQAGDRAASALAFGRAAELYGEALECLPEDLELKLKRADALVNAGRCAEAAPLYLEVAAHVGPEKALELRRRAAEQYLAAGRMPEGVGVLKPLLAELGLPYPETAKGALVGLIFRAILMQLGGMRLRERPQEQLPPRTLLRMDTTWTATKGLGSSDVMRGAYFAVRTLGMALAAGEPRRVARGLLGMGVTTLARGGASDVRSGERLVARGDALCQHLGDPYMLGLSLLVRGTAEMNLSRWRTAHGLLLEGVDFLESRCTGVAWELSQGYSCDVHSLTMLGELSEAALRGNRWLRVAQQNGDRFGGVWLTLNVASLQLALEGPDAAAQGVREAMSGWRSEGLTSQHVYAMVVGARCELYRGEPAAAWKHFEDTWKTAEKDHAMGWQYTRVMATELRAGTAVAMARLLPARRKELLELARSDARRMEKEGRHTARAAAALIRAAVATTEGRQEEALKALDASMAHYTEADMAVHAAAARRRKGELLGGGAGQALVEAADAEMRARGIRDPARYTACHAPGFSER